MDPMGTVMNCSDAGILFHAPEEVNISKIKLCAKDLFPVWNVVQGY